MMLASSSNFVRHARLSNADVHLPLKLRMAPYTCMYSNSAMDRENFHDIITSFFAS